MSDMKKENKYVKAYIDYLDMVLHLREAKECIEESFEYIDGVIDKLRIVINDTNYTDIRKLAAIAKIKSYWHFREDLKTKKRNLNELDKRVNGLIVDIRDKYDKHIYSIRKMEPFKTASPMAVHVGLKYGTLKDQFLAFLESVSKSNLFNDNDCLPRNTVSLVERSHKEINTNTSELTLIGTFSSGKTTMINTFLGHAHKLHTSKNHNTAVLMQIKKKPDNEQYEFYEVIYKKKLKWSLIKPAYLGTILYKNPFPGRTRVIDIRQKEQEYIVKLMEISGRHRNQNVHIGKMHKLCISRNDVIDGNSSLIKEDKSEKELKLASKTELQLLIDYILEKKLINPEIKVICRNREIEYKDESALRFLKKLSKCEKYNRVSIDSIQPMISAESLSKLMGEDIVFTTFFAEILVDGKRVKLDKKGWKEFCGTEEQGLPTSDKIPFCEAPECYMLAEHIDVYLDCEFLNYCSVNDTPGFGSITEEHDACTERFVNSSKSRLLAMITINSKSVDAKLYDFLYFIANIYQNFKKDQINEVYFMLNCFSNNASEKKLQSDIKKVAKLIVDLGFNEDNIYVCDLRKSTEESQEMPTMWGLPSYASFKKKCINNMLESGLVSRYRCIYDSWKSYFEDNIEYINERLSINEKNLQNGEKQIDAYKNKISRVNSLKSPSIDSILSDAKKKYDELYEEIKSVFCGSKKRSGFLWRNRERRESCNIIMNDKSFIGELEEFGGEIKKAVRYSLIELEIASEIYLDDELNDSDYTLFTLATENIKNKLMAADDNTHWYDKSDQTNYYMSEIYSIIEDDYKKSSERAREYFGELNLVYTNRKEQDLHTLNEELEGIENPEIIKQQIKSYNEIKVELSNLKKVFEKTINTDVLRRGKNE